MALSCDCQPKNTSIATIFYLIHLVFDRQYLGVVAIVCSSEQITPDHGGEATTFQTLKVFVVVRRLVVRGLLWNFTY